MFSARQYSKIFQKLQNSFFSNFRAMPWSDNFSLNQSETGPSCGGKSIFSQTFLFVLKARIIVCFTLTRRKACQALKLCRRSAVRNTRHQNMTRIGRIGGPAFVKETRAELSALRSRHSSRQGSPADPAETAKTHAFKTLCKQQEKTAAAGGGVGHMHRTPKVLARVSRHK